MRGVRLVDLEASEMLDVIHALFEEDNMAQSAEEFEARGKMRNALYRDLYGRTIRYGAATNDTTSDISEDPEESLLDDDLTMDSGVNAFDPLKREVKEPPKPYIPPTQFDPDGALPFGSVLDAPMG
jgi:hypothetical protein